MSAPPTPLHPAPDQEVNELPQAQLAADNLDLNPGLEDDLSGDDVSVAPLDSRENEKSEEPSVEIALWTVPFENAYDAELLKLLNDAHPGVNSAQQSKLVAYLDHELLQVQRKFVKNQAETRKEYTLQQLLTDLAQIVDVLWVLVSPEHAFFGQEEYFIKIMGDLEDWVDWYDLSAIGTDRTSEVLLLGLFSFFQKMDVRISLLVDGLSETNPHLKFDRTQLVRLFPIANRLRLIIVSKLRPLRDKLARQRDSNNTYADNLLNIVDVEVGRLFEGTLERS